MTIYRTTKAIKSHAKNGINVKARQPVTPEAFTDVLWQALIDDGAIVEVEETAVFSLQDMTIAELRKLADENGVSYGARTKRETLIKKLGGGNDATD